MEQEMKDKQQASAETQVQPEAASEAPKATAEDSAADTAPKSDAMNDMAVAAGAMAAAAKQLFKETAHAVKTEAVDALGTVKGKLEGGAAGDDIRRAAQEVKAEAVDAAQTVRENATQTAEEVLQKAEDASQAAGAFVHQAADAGEETAAQAKRETAERLDEATEKASAVLSDVKEEAKERTENIRREGASLFGKMKQSFRRFMENPQAELERMAQAEDKSAAWGFYGLMVALSFLAATFSGGVFAGVCAAAAAAVGALIYPALTCAVANIRRNRVSLRDTFSVFWIKGIPLYLLQLAVVVFSLFGFWPLILAVNAVRGILGLALNYMATLALSRQDSREALWTYLLTNLIVVAIATVLLVLLLVVFLGFFMGFMFHMDPGYMHGFFDMMPFYY